MAVHDLEISFLNLDDCNPEEREEIRAILAPSPRFSAKAGPAAAYNCAAIASTVTNSVLDLSAPNVPYVSNGMVDNNAAANHYHTSPAAYMLASEPATGSQPIFQQAYSATSAANLTTAATPACVFINNVTANVNVHHGAHLQEDVQTHPPSRPPPPHPPMPQYQSQPPLAVPAAGLLPTPHFTPVSAASSGLAPSYITPYPTQHLTSINKANAVQNAPMYPPVQHVYQQFFSPIHPFATPMAPYPQTMMGTISHHLPVTQGPPPGPLIRNQMPNPLPQPAPTASIMPPPNVSPNAVIKAFLPSPNVSNASPVMVAPIPAATLPPPPPAAAVAAATALIPEQQMTVKHLSHDALEVDHKMGGGSSDNHTAPLENGYANHDDQFDEGRNDVPEPYFDDQAGGEMVPEQVSQAIEVDVALATPEEEGGDNRADEDLKEDVASSSPKVAEHRPKEYHVTQEAIASNDQATAKAKLSEESTTAKIPSTKSWASLFHKESPESTGGAMSHKPMALIHPYSVDEGGLHMRHGGHNGVIEPRSFPASAMSLDSQDAQLALFLQKYVLNHKSTSLKPRGLSNRSNWCFMNAILQALVSCPPFFNLMKSMPEHLRHLEDVDEPSPVKILRAVHSFVAEFSPLDCFPKPGRRNKNKKNDDLPLGKSIEASSIFKVLLSTKKVIEGRQEDAEEFLTFLLNGLNDEMLSIMKLLNGKKNKDESVSLPTVGCAAPIEDDSDWLEVGPKNRSCITRREGHSSTDTGLKTPVAEMFMGQVRSCVTRSGGEPTATLQPFFTLQLDIQSDSVRNVANALTHNFAVEALDGYVCPKTKQEIEASRSLQLEELPPILILHLKRFIYDEMSGGCQKLLKNIDFPVDLEIPKDILSPNNKNKYQLSQKCYKLFAVVYHDGTEATKGHYVTDVYHTGLASWLHCDDSNIKSVTEATVLAHSARSLPYILFYRRCDTIVGLDKAKK